MAECMANGEFYHSLGRMDRVKEMETEIEPACLSLIEKAKWR